MNNSRPRNSIKSKMISCILQYFCNRVDRLRCGVSVLFELCHAADPEGFRWDVKINSSWSKSREKRKLMRIFLMHGLIYAVSMVNYAGAK